MIYLGNAFGIIAIILFALCYQMKSRRGIILVNTASRAFYVLQYILLGAFSGAVIDLIAGIMTAIFSCEEKLNKILKNTILILLYFAIIISSIIFYNNIFSLFSFIGVTFEVLAFVFKKEKSIRIVSLLSQPFWLIYNIYFLALSSAIGNVFTICSILISLYRYNFKK